MQRSYSQTFLMIVKAQILIFTFASHLKIAIKVYVINPHLLFSHTIRKLFQNNFREFLFFSYFGINKAVLWSNLSKVVGHKPFSNVAAQRNSGSTSVYLNNSI